MAEQKENKNSAFQAACASLFEGMDELVTTKTVVGAPVQVGETLILPLMDVSCGMGIGAFSGQGKNRDGGGMGVKMSPSAILVVQNGSTRLVNIKNQNTVNKVLDMVPDIVNKLSGGKVNMGEKFSEPAMAEAEKLAAEMPETVTKE